jgi:hypothetical protein
MNKDNLGFGLARGGSASTGENSDGVGELKAQGRASGAGFLSR